MKNKLYLDYVNDNDWRLYNENSLELDSTSYKEYANLFNLIYDNTVYVNNKTLIIGGGDYQLLNQIYNLSFQFTIVDPLVTEFKKFSKVLNINKRNNIKDYSLTFNSYFNYQYHQSFDTIIVDCSESCVSNTIEIYNVEFLKKLKKLTKENCKIYFYIPAEVIEMKHDFLKQIHTFFKIKSIEYKYITSWEENAYFYTLEPKKVSQHVHYSYTCKTNSSMLNNINNESFSSIMNTILLSYNIDIKVKTSYPFLYGGHSGSFILGESHFNWHTFPEDNLLRIDMYHCKYNKKFENIFKDINKYFNIDENSFTLDTIVTTPSTSFKNNPNNKILTFNNFTGSIKWSEDDSCYYGEILNIKDLIIYSANNINDLNVEFQNAVTNYIYDIQRKNNLIQNTSF